MSDTQRTERVQLLMTKDEVRSIDDWSFANRVRGRSEAIRRLVERGLGAEGEIPTAIKASIPTINDTMRKVDERKSAAVQGRKLAERGRRRAGLKSVPE